MGIFAGVKLAMVLKDVTKYGPVIFDLADRLKTVITGTKNDTAGKEIDKIQAELMEKMAEQNIRITEALEIIKYRIIINSVVSIIALATAALALVFSIAR